ncbi:MAG TPA: hypothetical protein VNQ73_02680 [Ilumatobacter sp.]|nr:hypothetical protein [Ilumatobacter sp.]
MSLVVDDHLLLDLLIGTAHGWLADETTRSAIYTTGSWYYRVASAADRGTGHGSLSGRVSALPVDDQRAVRSRLGVLPDTIGLVGPRTLIPVMASLRSPRPLNYLSTEALAVAILTESTIAVRTDSPPLREASESFRIPYRVFDAA